MRRDGNFAFLQIVSQVIVYKLIDLFCTDSNIVFYATMILFLASLRLSTENYNYDDI